MPCRHRADPLFYYILSKIENNLKKVKKTLDIIKISFKILLSKQN
jgi:hypothetical protein